MNRISNGIELVIFTTTKSQISNTHYDEGRCTDNIKNSLTFGPLGPLPIIKHPP